MNRDLKYFKVFFDTPEVLSDEEFEEKYNEFIEFIGENEDKLNFRTWRWEQRKRRILADKERRGPITPQMREELAEITSLFENLDRDDDAATLGINRRMLSFMKQHQVAFECSDERIANFEEKIKRLEQSIIKSRIADREAEYAQIVLDDSMKELDEAIAEQVERTGKTPILPAYSGKKKHTGN